MAQVIGSSADKGQAAVVGNHLASGDGIWGQSDGGRGIVGVSANGEGVGIWGHTRAGRAVVAVCDGEGAGAWAETGSGRGAVGIVRSGGDGVWGEAGDGRGVVGVSKDGQAGFFEGNVGITGNLVVGGVDFAALTRKVAELEQRIAPGNAYADRLRRVGTAIAQAAPLYNRIAVLERDVAALKARRKPPSTPPPPAATVTIDVPPGSGNIQARVSGRGFTPNDPIDLTLTQTVQGRTPSVLPIPNTAADAAGVFDRSVTVTRAAGETVTYRVRAEDRHGRSAEDTA